MNSFGRIFKVNIFGESHGACVGVNIDGCPAGLPISVEDFLVDIERRKGGIQKGTTPRQETDLPIFKSGIFNNYTTGAPITILFENNNTRSDDYQKQRDFPRPGHADFVAHEKFGGFEDFRGGGHFSGRLTVCLVAVGVIAKKILSSITIKSSILEIGGEKDLEKGLQKAIDNKDSIGGIVDCRVSGLPIALGEHFFDSVESLISHAVFAIPAVKGIEFGAGFTAAKMFGAEHNDAIVDNLGTTSTNHSGGIVGGITNSNELVFRIAIKPTSSTPKPQQSLNWNTNEVESFSIKGRHDLCIALRVPVVLEAVTAMVLVDLMMLENKIPRVLAQPNQIYHITTKDAWEQALIDGFYTADSLESEGFIHCSTQNQLSDTLERFFKGQSNLVRLEINPKKLSAALKYELAPSINEYFPHVFGTINLDAVLKVVSIN